MTGQNYAASGSSIAATTPIRCPTVDMLGLDKTVPVMGCPDTGVRLYVSVRLPAPLYEMPNGMPRGMLAGAGDAPNDTALPAWTAWAVCATGLQGPGASAIAADTAGCGGIINAPINGVETRQKGRGSAAPRTAAVGPALFDPMTVSG